VPEKASWIERKFKFDLPVSMFPNVLERLRGTPARVEERVRGLPAEAMRKRTGESWSILENIGHLTQVEGLWLGRLDDFATGLDELRPADMSNQRTFEADYNSGEPDEVLAEFRQFRAEYVERLEKLTDEEIGRAAYHRRLDRPMRILDAMVFAAEHDDHHLARITEMLRSG
jgi:uncharacterized damage-inducible protein DinB